MAKENKDRESKKRYTQDDINKAIEFGKRISIPHETAPATHKRLERLECAIFGNEDEGEIGMKEKIDKIYEFFTGASFARKILIGFFVAIGTVAGGILATIELLKKIK